MNYTPSILSALDTMRKSVLAEGGKTAGFKAKAYDKVIKEIKALDHPITKYEDVASISGIGEKIKDKIEEILATGSLASAERAKATYNLDATDELKTIHGIGDVKARELIAAGIKSISDLKEAFKKNPKLLTAAQTLGLKYHDSSVLRIPRKEMTLHEDVIKAYLPATLDATIVGSYRRGAADSGDVDVLVSYKGDEKAAIKRFAEYIKMLEETGYILDKLSGGEKKWMGYAKVGALGTPRRLDVLLTPPEEYAYAILYFTGSDKFNVAFRGYAKKKGYTINEHKMVPTGDAAVPPGMKTEKDIFDFLGLRYVPPEERKDERQVVPVAV